jgi:bacillopeptidase F (M6 metalloprotease family)
MTGRGEAKTPPPAKTYTSDGGVTVIEKGATKQFQFTETDVEGRLKVPQLVYFLRRVRAEFAAGDLGHRSFMRELSATQRDPDF